MLFHQLPLKTCVGDLVRGKGVHDWIEDSGANSLLLGGCLERSQFKPSKGGLEN